jgi:hypothetical protein
MRTMTPALPALAALAPLPAAPTARGPGQRRAGRVSVSSR